MVDNIIINVAEHPILVEIVTSEGIGDAPVDGSIYGRLNSAWEIVAGAVRLWTRSSSTSTLSPSTPNDNIDAGEGYITGRKCGVFAHLSKISKTECTLADTWYPIQGAFINNPMEDFSFGVNQIIYNGIKTQYFEIDAHATVQGENNGIVLHFGVKINNILFDGSIMGQFLKTKDEPFAISGTSVIELSETDTVQFVVKSDLAGQDIRFNHLTATISEFFD